MHPVPRPGNKTSLLDRIVRSKKGLETPESYWWWSSLAAIAGVIRKQIFLDRFEYKLYPNVAILIVSKHSGLRKGNAISLAKKLLEGVGNTRIIDGRNSIQAIISELGRAATLDNGLVLSDAQCILLSDEVDNFLVKDDAALTIFTQLFNTHEHEKFWRNSLKGTGVEVLKQPCINFLGASNESLLEDFIQKKDIEGGFLARNFVVYEDKKACTNSLTRRPPNLTPVESFFDEMKEISKVQGEYQFSPKAADYFDEWYAENDQAIASDEITDGRTGFAQRIGDGILKVAMLINLAGKRDLTIHCSDLQEAIVKVESCYRGIHRVTGTASPINKSSGIGTQIQDLLVKAPDQTLTRRQLMFKLKPHVNLMMFQEAMDTLQAQGVVTVRAEKTGDRKEYLYTMSELANKLHRGYHLT